MKKSESDFEPKSEPKSESDFEPKSELGLGTKVYDFLVSEKKISELSRLELMELHGDPSCPEFLHQCLASELTKRLH